MELKRGYRLDVRNVPRVDLVLEHQLVETLLLDLFLPYLGLVVHFLVFVFVPIVSLAFVAVFPWTVDVRSFNFDVFAFSYRYVGYFSLFEVTLCLSNGLDIVRPIVKGGSTKLFGILPQLFLCFVEFNLDDTIVVVNDIRNVYIPVNRLIVNKFEALLRNGIIST